eukprot:CAMPEP_0178966406 /NCGR_PEP_ID=MMETSP0789-20121207/16899_1 /TAXON_ID=3005 /ORGANISM="Rhizosolenia setigera, Strain CCMP 1694" /LENGTH=57 /DNA_ID=CAMNT_0020651657 /DNA_START=231 /DNA_END=401 /DNA_ORIENTATION=-
MKTSVLKTKYRATTQPKENKRRTDYAPLNEDECFEDEVQSHYSTEREQEEDGLRSPA